MADLRPREIKAFLKVALENPEKMRPLFIWGPPGIGKSAVVREAAEEFKVGFVDIRASQRDPTDIRGIPAVIKSRCYICGGTGKFTVEGKEGPCPLCIGKGEIDGAKWLPPPEMPQDPTWKGFIFLDELLSAPKTTQAAYYQLTLDRRISEYVLPKGAYILGASNNLEDRAIVYPMSTALANRFTHVDFIPNIDDWIEWAFKAKIDPTVIAYIKWKQDMLCPKFNPDTSQHAYPTPRSWEAVSQKLQAKLSDTLTMKLIEGDIGMGATAEFSAFLKLKTELPDPMEIINGKDWVPTRIDLKYALVSSLSTIARGKDQFERLINYSDKLGKEFGVLLIQMLALKDEKALVVAPSFEKWARGNSSVIIRR